MEALKAAIKAGCDAVYLGGKNFGARAYSSNFTNEEIIEAINYAHLYGIKIYITVNTLIYDNEVEQFLEYIEFLHKNNVDAVIMQDIGMIDLVRKTYPNLEIHASTQMHIHNIEGVKVCEKLGIKRVVLARELSLTKIKEIKEKTTMPLEVFVHGALCISYSGQCLMSSLINKRSGNRGTCSQCCRMPYDLISNNKKINKDKYLLSTKDLCTIQNLDKIIESGVSSIKIEGRMKRYEYVYEVVSIYRKAIDNYYQKGYIDINDIDIERLYKIFNREFTTGYLFDNEYIVNQKRPNHIGIKIGNVIEYKNKRVYIKLNKDIKRNDGIRIISKKDVGLTLINFYKNNKLIEKAKSGDTIYFYLEDIVYPNDTVVLTTSKEQLDDIKEKLKNNKLININGNIKINKEGIVLNLSDGINEVSVTSDKVEPAKNISIKKEDIYKQISKMGNTIYNLDKLDIELEDNLFVSIHTLNDIRRNIVDKLNQKRLYKYEFIKKDYNIELKDYNKEYNINIKIYNEEQYNYYKDKYRLYTDDIELYNKHPDIYYINDRVIDNYTINNNVMVSEIGGLNCTNFETDYSFNVTNSYTVAFLHSIGSNKVTLSYELDYYQVNYLLECYYKRYKKRPNVEVIIYGNIESMVSKFNLLKYYNIDNGYLKDEFNNKYKLKIHNNKLIIYHYKKRDLKEDYLSLVNNVRYDLNDMEIEDIKN